jgi:hypothetical protein
LDPVAREADRLLGETPDSALLRALAADKEVFMADVLKDQHLYLEDPQSRLPPSLGRTVLGDG